MRRTFTAVAVTAAMTLAPVGAAFAQDAGTDETTGTAETTEVADAGSLLEAWLAAIQDLYDQLTGAEETDDGSTDDGAGEGSEDEGTGETGDAALLETLLQALLDGVEIEFMVAEAMEEADEEDGTAGTEEEGTEEDTELTEETDEGTEEADEPHGHVVRLVAQCAPRGQEARGFLAGAANHGAYVSAVARGDAISLTVPTIEEDEDGNRTLADEPTIVDMTVTTVEDAEAFCAALATIAEARALEAELAAAEEREDGDGVGAASAREQRQADRDAAKAERAAEREQRKAERDEAKAQRAAQRAAAKAERRGR